MAVGLLLLLACSVSAIEIFHTPNIYDNFFEPVMQVDSNYTSDYTGWLTYKAIIRCRNESPNPDSGVFRGQLIQARATYLNQLVFEKSFIFDKGCYHEFTGKLVLYEPAPNLNITFGLRTENDRVYDTFDSNYVAPVVPKMDTVFVNSQDFLGLGVPSVTSLAFLLIAVLLAIVAVILFLKTHSVKVLLWMMFFAFLSLLIAWFTWRQG